MQDSMNLYRVKGGVTSAFTATVVEHRIVRRPDIGCAHEFRGVRATQEFLQR